MNHFKAQKTEIGALNTQLRAKNEAFFIFKEYTLLLTDLTI